MSEKDRPQSNVEIKIGDISFSAEGDPAWLSEQVARVMEAASKVPVVKATRGIDPASANSSGGPPDPFGGSLSSCLKATGGENKQVRRFLATAAWQFKRGQTNLKASTVAKALSEHHQKGLANPADCLNQNVAKGYCEKTKDGFFITPEGWNSLGSKQ
jgi:hypothetical protein